MGDLAQGVDASVGTAGALNIHLAAQQMLRRLQKLALNGAGIRLYLPTPIGRAVILQGKFIFVHNTNISLHQGQRVGYGHAGRRGVKEAVVDFQ